MRTSIFPSIQSFFEREVKTPQSNLPSSAIVKNEHNSDGFTSSEINEVLDPSTINSNLARAYQPCPIMLLEMGARHYEIGGRIVNFSRTPRKRQNPEESEGFWYLTVSDGTGMIGVNLHCRNRHEYQPLLGQRVTIWASFIGVSVGGEFNQTPCSTSVYPGRSGTTHIVFHKDSDGCDLFRSPLRMTDADTGDLPGLMTLQEFLNTGFEYEEAKILVCVRSVGLRRTVRARTREVPINLVEVGIFDHTASIMLTLWGDVTPSAGSWVPNKTVLLISMPKYNPEKCDIGQPARISLNYNSIVEVNPTFGRAEWLRSTIERRRQREAFFIHFPSEEWNKALAPKGAERVLYTIAEMEERITSDDSTSFTGKLNVMVLQVSLLEHWRLETIGCTECCGVPLCANKVDVMCRNCGTTQRLSMNPRTLKTFIDESGCLAGSKLVWSDDAWKQFLLPDSCQEEHDGGTPPAESWQQILELKTSELREYEEALLYSRVTLTFGWSPSIRRLCVLGVEW
ncbi:uncharacterized protein B0I36DRAFT_248255 [Microdochium trichocladiopsis]|uniref:Nucleic acid-binding protein n=1 Tax=Microdochium trichocladiopsis TaxID=1682393 RepID=A0A9P8XY22_9PEZI|nr:uncharacterized protein B0I36DRAFT_248255 [Microdochium trichocladiopsis]KAH7025740.1 hypothetical protein B0I36DRAFT_248255 [Microdochium trichocladiopsis]